MENKNISISFLDVKKENIPLFFNECKTVIEKLKESALKSKQTLKKELFSKFNYIIHFDVMDNKFVPNSGVDIEYLKTAKNLGLYTDTHLMVENPIGDKYVEKAISYGTDEITIHYEIENFESVIKYLNERKEYLKINENRNLVIGVALKPNTNIEEILKYKGRFSKVLLMSVEPGFGGQKYIDETNERIKKLKKLLPNVIIEVDGGVNFKTIRKPLLCGADSFVIGSYITKSNINLYDIFLRLNSLYMIEEIPKDSNVEFDKKLLQIVKGGYGEGDNLIGITVPNLRKLVNGIYNEINLISIKEFISSNIHEYRRFACFCLSNKMKKENDSLRDMDKMKHFIDFLNENIEYINNWDLTDDIGPNVLGIYISNLKLEEAKEKINYYISSSNIWQRRIGVVSCLVYARRGYKQLPLYICKKVLYDENLLINKAVGWVLRELYKKCPYEVLEFLKENNNKKRLPRFVISYACEKMSANEKNEFKN